MSFAKKEIIFGACDSQYFIDFGLSFVYSSLSSHNCTHIHIVNPTSEVGSLLDNIKKQHNLFTFSSHNIDFSSMNDEQIRGYYISMRFFIIPHLFEIDKNIKLLVLDIDSIVKKTIKMPKESLGIFLREHNANIEFKIAAGILYVTYERISFINKVISNISNYQKNNQLRWYVDQRALYLAYKELENKNDIYCFTQEYCSWQWHKNAYVWTGKGERKFRDKIFLESKKYFDNMFVEDKLTNEAIH